MAGLLLLLLIKPHRTRLTERGRSSGVEHNLAKVGVEGSNPFARSNFPMEISGLERSFEAALLFTLGLAQECKHYLSIRAKAWCSPSVLRHACGRLDTPRPSAGGGKGNCFDNAIVETFFRTMKSELVWRTLSMTRLDAETAIGHYINGF